ncbi:hypothetical protein TSOC_014747, partial [Tetrabaena socialis]
PPGYEGVGPAVCLELKPKWGLHPGEGIAADGLLEDTRAATAAQGCSDEAATAADGDAAADAAADGDAAADAAVGAAGASGPGALSAAACSVLRRYPRYLLHILHKHVKDGAPLSYYNPLDLFSGEPGRMQVAVQRLMESPSNNLRVFRDGVPVYGKGAVDSSSGEGGGGSSREPGSTGPPVPQPAAGLQRLAAVLHDLVRADEAGSTGRAHVSSGGGSPLPDGGAGGRGAVDGPAAGAVAGGDAAQAAADAPAPGSAVAWEVARLVAVALHRE